MTNKNLAVNYQDGIPDEEMPELRKKNFAKAKPNRFNKYRESVGVLHKKSTQNLTTKQSV